MVWNVLPPLALQARWVGEVRQRDLPENAGQAVVEDAGDRPGLVDAERLQRPGPKPFWLVGAALDEPEICVIAREVRRDDLAGVAPLVGVSVIVAGRRRFLAGVSNVMLPRCRSAAASPEALQFQVWLVGIRRIALEMSGSWSAFRPGCHRL